MRRFRKVHLIVSLVVLLAALSAFMAGPVSAKQTVCTGFAGDIDNNVTVIGL